MLDVKTAMEILNKSLGNNTYEVTIPSTKQKVIMKPMTVGMRKTFSKFAMIDDKIDDLNFQFAKVGLVKSLCMSDMNEYKLTEVDVIGLLAQILNNNLLEDIILTITCNNCKCQFKTKLDFQKIIEKCLATQFPVAVFEKEIKGVKYKFTLAKPYFLDVLTMQKAIIENEELDDKDIDINKPMAFIKDIFINGEQIDFKALDEKIQIIDNLPAELAEGKNDIYEKILQEFPMFNNQEIDLFQIDNCPKCNEVMEGVVTSDNFFIY